MLRIQHLALVLVRGVVRNDKARDEFLEDRAVAGIRSDGMGYRQQLNEVSAECVRSSSAAKSGDIVYEGFDSVEKKIQDNVVAHGVPMLPEIGVGFTES